MIKSIYKSILPERTRIDVRLRLQRLAYPLYLGNEFTCNCCGKSFRKLLPKGNIRRPDAKCPYCSSLERVRVLDFYLDMELDIYNKPGMSILHFAPEKCLEKKISSIDGVEYVDGDINPAYANHVVDITEIQYEDNYFDLIICSHVLGHVPNESRAIQEMFRVLKKNGTAIIMTLLDREAQNTFEDESIVSSQDRLRVYGEADLYRLHGLDFADRIRTHGFEVEENDYRMSLPAEVRRRYSLGDGQREILFICKK